MENMFIVKECMFVELKKGIWSPDDNPEQINEWFQVVTQKDMSQLKHPVTADLYNKISKQELEWGNYVDVTYPVLITKDKLGLGKAVSVKKSPKK